MSNNVNRIVIPYPLRDKLIMDCHTNSLFGGHMGTEKIIDKMKQRFYWQGMDKDIEMKIKACKNCQKCKTGTGQRIPEPIYSIIPPSQPFQRVHIDIVGPFPETDEFKFKYIFTCIDAFSKFITLCPIRNMKATTIATTFIDNILTKFGTPVTVVSDNGKQFVSSIFKQLSKLFGFEHRLITPYNPQANGVIERINRTIVNMLSVYTTSSNWDSFLQMLCFTYNTSIHNTTSFSPFYVMFLRDPILPVDIVLKLAKNDNIFQKDFTSYIQEQAKHIYGTWEIVELEIRKSQERQKLYGDLSRKAKEHNIQEQDLVLIWKTYIKNDSKLMPHWVGPFRVLKINPPNLILKSIGDKNKIFTEHLNKVKKFKTPSVLPFRKLDQPISERNEMEVKQKIKFNDPNLEESDSESELSGPKNLGQMKNNKIKYNFDDKNLEQSDSESELEPVPKIHAVQCEDDTDTLIWILNNINTPKSQWPTSALIYDKKMRSMKLKPPSELQNE